VAIALANIAATLVHAIGIAVFVVHITLLLKSRKRQRCRTESSALLDEASGSRTAGLFGNVRQSPESHRCVAVSVGRRGLHE
ncbi:MAG TPA: hypothetical protein VFV64_01575, partial [Permianibacter sp.]|nr:hypothetical protein [Permianibacter sp.]